MFVTSRRLNVGINSAPLLAKNNFGVEALRVDMVCQAHVIQWVVAATQWMASNGLVSIIDVKTGAWNMTGPLQTRLVMITDRKCFS